MKSTGVNHEIAKCSEQIDGKERPLVMEMENCNYTKLSLNRKERIILSPIKIYLIKANVLIMLHL